MITNIQRTALIGWLKTGNWPLFCTLAVNGGASLAALESMFDGFCFRLDRRLLGPRFLKKVGKATVFFGFVEHAATNIHIHCVARLGDGVEVNLHRFIEAVEFAWQRVAPSGSIDVQLVYDESGLYRYITKESWCWEEDVPLIMSRHR